MICIHNPSLDPAFNLAAEEYLLQNSREDCFMLWRSAPCIVVGRNQNPYSQVNCKNIRETGLPVLRRLSGGGAVYHDQGNLNYSFIHHGRAKAFPEFEHFLKNITGFLAQYGIETEIKNTSSLYAGGRKFSGNAQHIKKNRMLHHGTLLFSTDLNALTQSLSGPNPAYQDKSVDSIRAQVVNLQDLLPDFATVEDFSRDLMRHVRQMYYGRSQAFLSEDQALIEALAARYRRWAWNYGQTPPYHLKAALPPDAGAELNLKVRRGIITGLELAPCRNGDGVRLEKALMGCRHDFESIVCALGGNNGDGPMQIGQTTLRAEMLF